MNTEKEYVHIDSEVHIRTGTEAREALERENDARFLSADQGIVRVTPERWFKAQAAERKHWMVLGVAASNDRNDEHLRGFDGYKALQGRSFPHAIELGCGPFTNLRAIAEICEVGVCSLLDPLLHSYLSHAHAAYDERRLLLDNGRMAERTLTPLRRTWARAKRRMAGLLPPEAVYRTIPIRRLLATPIEYMPEDERYDLVVMINVLEHCFDVDLILQKILRITPPGGIFVFHDKYYDHKTVYENAPKLYDAAHPLRVDGRVVEAFCARHFTSLYSRTSRFEYMIRNTRICSRQFHFIGARS